MKENQNFMYVPPPPPPPPLSLQSNSGDDLNGKISPSILLIIIILSIIFFISGLLHLLLRFLLSPPNRDQNDFFDNVTALQGQLQQLFHLHDSGVDQSYIDTLPTFHYKSIVGLKNNYPFDCAVCLCEFESDDKLRLLPKCSHAFHIDCIDAWLLSHSTCPLCRSNLLTDFSSQFNSYSPYLLVLESGSDHGSAEIVTDRDSSTATACVADADNGNSHLGFDENQDLESTHFDSGHKSCWVPPKNDEIHNPNAELADSDEKAVPFHIKLGKFRNLGVGGEGSSNTSRNVDERRCFSMGSYEYIMDEESILKVHVSKKKQSSKSINAGLYSGHRAAKSECGYDSTRGFNFFGFESMRLVEEEASGKSIVKDEDNRERSFSVSKTWLRGKKEKQQKAPRDHQDCSSASSASNSSRRAFSFRFSIQRNSSDAKSEVGFCDEENQKSENFESLETKTPSFARRTMLWLVGRQNKVVHSSAASMF